MRQENWINKTFFLVGRYAAKSSEKFHKIWCDLMVKKKRAIHMASVAERKKENRVRFDYISFGELKQIEFN